MNVLNVVGKYEEGIKWPNVSVSVRKFYNNHDEKIIPYKKVSAEDANVSFQHVIWWRKSA